MNRFVILVGMAVGFCLCSYAQETRSSSSAGGYKTFSEDGGWCWFSDPRAVYLNGKVYSGWVSADGSIMVASYNERTDEVKEINLYPQFNRDDHANPSILVLPDNRIMVFFTAHSTLGRGEEEAGITYAISRNPEDVTEWEGQQRITQNAPGPRKFCYTNPVMLSEEDNRIYLFWRGGDWRPTFCFSDDLGKTWSGAHTLIKSSLQPGKRPYVKIASNGRDEIHFAFTDGHPRREPFNSIYYLKYKDGKFYKADDSEVGSMGTLPIEHEQSDVVYDAREAYSKHYEGARAWIWDVAAGPSGAPVVVYTRLPEETKHQYYYANWDGSAWSHAKISNAGSAFPRFKRTKEQRDPEPHYSGGVVLDHENPRVVYYSKPVNDIFEVFKAEMHDDGEGWVETAITMNSNRDSVRPYSVRGAGSRAGVQVLWMFNDRYRHYTDYHARIKMDLRR